MALLEFFTLDPGIACEFTHFLTIWKIDINFLHFTVGPGYLGGGGQKIKKLEFELACKMPPFYMLYWFQKHKDQLWGPLENACPKRVNFGPKIQRKWGQKSQKLDNQLWKCQVKKTYLLQEDSTYHTVCGGILIKCAAYRAVLMMRFLHIFFRLLLMIKTLKLLLLLKNMAMLQKF